MVCGDQDGSTSDLDLDLDMTHHSNSGTPPQPSLLASCIGSLNNDPTHPQLNATEPESREGSSMVAEGTLVQTKLVIFRECHGFTNPYRLRSWVGTGWHFHTPVKPAPVTWVSWVLLGYKNINKQSISFSTIRYLPNSSTSTAMTVTTTTATTSSLCSTTSCCGLLCHFCFTRLLFLTIGFCFSTDFSSHICHLSSSAATFSAAFSSHTCCFSSSALPFSSAFPHALASRSSSF
jgi:hypothetical protein